MERKDTEPIFGDEEFQNVFRGSSINPTDSMMNLWNANTSFSSGTISATSTTTVSADPGLVDTEDMQMVNLQQLQHLLQQPVQEQQTHEINPGLITNQAVIEMGVADAGPSTFGQQWHTLDQALVTNGEYDMVPPDAVLPPNLGHMKPEPESSVDSSHTPPQLSLQPWPGIFNFQRLVPIDNKDKNKWCYSTLQKKLYVTPNVAVPVGIQLSEPMTSATLRITPAFKQSQHFVEPVVRCHNCTRKSNWEEDDVKDYICQVDGESADYAILNGRHVVSLPLQPPPPGETVTNVLVKIMCLTSCVGGPNRKPFVLVFEIFHRGQIVGRQVLDVKCCKCPSRDMGNDEKGCRGGKPATCTDQENYAKVQKLASELQVGKKRKYPKIKLETQSDQQFVTFKVPQEIADQVKLYINALMEVRHVPPQDRYLP